MRKILLLLMVLALTAFGCSKSDAQTGKQGGETAMTQAASDDAAIKAGLLPADKAPEAPDWELKTVDGGTMKLSDHRGKVVILDFWDTWCPPCRAEIPGFVEMQKKYGDKLVIIGAAFGNEGPEAVKSFIKEYGMNYPVVYVTAQVNQMYGGIQSIPTTFVIDKNGKARGMHVGFAEREVFEKEVEALF